MRIISQLGDADVKYEDGALKVEGSSVYYVSYTGKILLGIYPLNDGEKKVLKMIKEAALQKEEYFNMPNANEV